MLFLGVIINHAAINCFSAPREQEILKQFGSGSLNPLLRGVVWMDLEMADPLKGGLLRSQWVAVGCMRFLQAKPCSCPQTRFPDKICPLSANSNSTQI